MIPKRLEDWTLDLVFQLATSGVLENDIYDFKAGLQSADHQRKTVAAFANTRGGFMVFGVAKERQIHGVESPELLVRNFGNAIVSGLEPSVDYRFGPPLVVDSTRCICIGHVSRSERGPHAVWEKERWVFYKRTASGSCISATRDEIRDAFLDSDRRRSQLGWLRAEVQRIRDLAFRLNVKSSRETYDVEVLARLRADQLRTLLFSVFVYIQTSPSVVTGLQQLIERCEAIDHSLAIIEQSVLQPRDRSFSRAGLEPRQVIRHHVPDTVMLADRLLAELVVPV